MILLCIQQLMKENLLLLKDLLEPKGTNYMTSISKNVYIDKLYYIVNEYNNTYHRTIKMKPINVKNNTYINIYKKVNNKKSKFKVGDHVSISKYKPIKYGRDFMRIKFESNDDLRLGKILSIPVCVIAVGSVFNKGNN